MLVADLELDLDVFAGPFDLLLTLVLREEVDLLEVDLAEVVLAYLDHLDRRGELDLEAATEFLVLVAAVLELKSRLMLPGADPDLTDLAPQEAAEELLARLLDNHRFRGAAEHLSERLRLQSGHRFRSAPLPAQLRRAPLGAAEAVYDPARLGAAVGALLRVPPRIELDHIHHPRVSVAERLAALRALLRRGSFAFDEAIAGVDRATIATTLYALLELHRRGEASWLQAEPLAEITVTPASPPAPEGRREEVGAT